MSKGIELIAAERKRQIEVEGFNAEHDGQHTKNELALAAAIYAMPDNFRYIDTHEGCSFVLETLWPWSCNENYKPSKDRIHELTKAGALIAAEIDRLSRIKD